jgi:regulator of PEP synthase PpsR (kinase-PPPase family)
MFAISAGKVAMIKMKRSFCTAQSDCANIEAIRGKLRYGHKIFRQIKGIKIIDVANSSIEEISD